MAKYIGNIKINNMQENQTKNIIEGRIPPLERNNFQIFLMQELGAEHGNLESQNELIKYLKPISNIIDDEKNIEIRSSIMTGDHKKAAELVLDMLGIKRPVLVHN